VLQDLELQHIQKSQVNKLLLIVRLCFDRL
jgi:hypothetical protein